MKAFLHFILTCSGQCSQRPSMERHVERDNLVPTDCSAPFGIATRQLDRSFIRFRSRGTEEYRIRTAVIREQTWPASPDSEYEKDCSHATTDPAVPSTSPSPLGAHARGS